MGNFSHLPLHWFELAKEPWTQVYRSTGTPCSCPLCRGEAEYERLLRARHINEDAANASASWGMFQIMGFNHAACGEPSLANFVNSMCQSECRQLLLSVRFIRGNRPMLAALQKKDWKAFARLYNGPAYAQNRYDEKLSTAFYVNRIT